MKPFFEFFVNFFLLFVVTECISKIDAVLTEFSKSVFFFWNMKVSELLLNNFFFLFEILKKWTIFLFCKLKKS